MAYPVGYPMDGGTYPSKEAKINWEERREELKEYPKEERKDERRMASP